MKNFTFSLKALLVLRTQQKEQALQVWALASQELHQNNLELQRIQTQMKNWQNLHREKQASAISAGDLTRNHQATEQLYKNWLGHVRLHQRLQNRVRETLAKWHEARQKEEMMENLKKKAFFSWSKEFEREEQKLNDERASLLAFHNNSNQSITGNDLQLSTSP
jgi:flagellar export protein FliJ